MLGLLAACGACTTQAPQPERPLFDAGVALPDGPGREILVASCLSCHDLGGLELFKGFYTRDSWHALVMTMVEHGARVDGDEVEKLADYLEQYFGPSAR